MSDLEVLDFEDRLLSVANDFPYPPTPDIASWVDLPEKSVARSAFPPRRRLALVLVLLVVLLASLIAVPEVRARLLDFLQIGSVRIFLAEPTPIVSLTAALGSGREGLLVTPTREPVILAIPPTATPDYSSDIVSVLDLDGETSLTELRSQPVLDFRLPTYPPNLGLPDRIFYQQLGGGQFAVFVWLHPGSEERVRITLYALGEGAAGFKGQPQVVAEAQVNGERALWTDGPHYFFIDGSLEIGRLVDSPVLIWTEAGLTYRLEADLSQEEMIKIDESLQ